MSTLYGYIDGRIWNLDTEEPVEELTSTDAEEAAIVEEELALEEANA